MNKLILFELNEVPIRIVDYFRGARPSSWIARNYTKLKKFTTVSENQGHLSPWNTWPTVHRGVSNDRHFIADFNQDLSEVDREFPPIWQLLSRSGIRTGLFGSLHSYPLPSDLSGYDFYIPDVFAAGSECFPDRVEAFQEINLRLSRGSARNVDPGVPYGDVLKGLRGFRGLGFRLGTIADVGGQIVQEKLDPWKTVRRRTYQSVLAFDVFYKLLRDKQPDFVTFFTNHVASSMHRYWAAAFPDEYEDLRYDREWIDTYDNEILFAMGKADKMLERLGRFVDTHPEYKLLVTSSMGQHAIECEPVETQLYIVDHGKFMSMLHLEPGDYAVLPAMLPQFNYAISDAKTSLFENNLRQLRVNGELVGYRQHEGGSFSIDLGQPNLKETAISLNGRSVNIVESGMDNVVIEDKSSSTAYHIPEGHLFSYHPSHHEEPLGEHELPTTEIAPLILRNFGVSVPGYMKSSTVSDHLPV
ncbi:MAG TPA: hypothetical protein VNA17_11930 [Pyrinomonadaceae bacterium]|nr:hypothetical protein [Pyrinomonadaceae bacterium]